MNKYRIVLSALLLTATTVLYAQVKAPKWAEKSKQAVLHITTYSKDSTVLHEGTAFFVDEQGTAFSNYSLFKGAHYAKAKDAEGVEMDVDLIMGVNDLYDAIKIHILSPKKKAPFLKMAATKPQVGEEAILLAYSPGKELNFVVGAVDQIAPLGGDSYYTLSLVLADSQISSPLLNAQGEVFGLAQQAVSTSSGKAYAISASFIKNLSIVPLSLNDRHLNGISIPKDLPVQQDQALAMLYLAGGSADQNRYYELLNRFINRYPTYSEGYQLRSAYYTMNFEDPKYLEMAEKDMELTLKYDREKDNAYYHNSQSILNYAVRHDSAAYKDWSLQKCLDVVQKAIAIKPLPVYYLHEANIYSLMKQYQKAYDAYDSVNHSNIASASTFYAASRLKRIMDDTTGVALSLMDSCIAHLEKPYGRDAAAYLFERAEMRVYAGLNAEAVEDYDAYELCAPSRPNAYFYYKREQAAMAAGKLDKALEDIQKALKLLPTDPTLLEEQGSIFLAIYRYDDAIKSLNAALEKDPERPYSYRLKGYALLQQDKKEEARKALERGKELGDEVAGQLLTRYFKE